MSNETLLKQLANRAKAWHQSTGISQAALAAALNMEEGNYSGFLKGKRGISAEATCSLLEFIKLPKRQAIAKLNRPILSSRSLELQERGRPMVMRFDNSGWTAQEGSNSDPNDHGDITSTPSAVTATVADLTSVFQTLDHLTRKAVIDSFIAAHAAANTIPTSQKFSRKRK
jgi:transcriptional regulator with XRE-family HTH domain